MNITFKNQKEIYSFPTEWDMFSSEEIKVDLLLLFVFFIIVAKSVLFYTVPS